MGLKGKKPRRISRKEIRVWRAYLLRRALGYLPTRAAILAAVAKDCRVSLATATYIVQDVSPVGVFG
jgi:hypothetical protein